jgi:glycine/D-amino acid oxidase-like deaminating enzyme
MGTALSSEMADLNPYARVSFWFDSLSETVGARPALEEDLDVDVAIIGGGYTGLWTAYYLQKIDPSMSIAILEREVCGFGASGRNGGWCSGNLAASWPRIARRSGVSAATRLRRAMEATVDEVGKVSAEEGIDCDFEKGGTVEVCRSDVQLARARAEVDAARAAGVGEGDLALLDRDRARELIGATEVVGATYTPHCASLQPARLARGLAAVVEGRGARVFEQTTVESVAPHTLRCGIRTVTAKAVVRATEGFTPSLPGSSRRLLPIYSLMVATEPIPDSTWREIGLARRETFNDYRHLFIYGQRTKDGRLAFGGRGAPYHYGSRISPKFDRVDSVHEALRRSIVELFPQLSGIRITHRWGGPIGVPRDWYPSVTFDEKSGRASAGGYVGYGVGASNLAGQTLADLICRRDTELVRHPWVNHLSPRWEPEPLRFIGVNFSIASMRSGDRFEERSGRASRRAAFVEHLLQS